VNYSTIGSGLCSFFLLAWRIGSKSSGRIEAGDNLLILRLYGPCNGMCHIEEMNKKKQTEKDSIERHFAGRMRLVPSVARKRKALCQVWRTEDLSRKTILARGIFVVVAANNMHVN